MIDVLGFTPQKVWERLYQDFFLRAYKMAKLVNNAQLERQADANRAGAASPYASPLDDAPQGAFGLTQESFIDNVGHIIVPKAT